MLKNDILFDWQFFYPLHPKILATHPKEPFLVKLHTLVNNHISFFLHFKLGMMYGIMERYKFRGLTNSNKVKPLEKCSTFQ